MILGAPVLVATLCSALLRYPYCNPAALQGAAGETYMLRDLIPTSTPAQGPRVREKPTSIPPVMPGAIVTFTSSLSPGTNVAV